MCDGRCNMHGARHVESDTGQDVHMMCLLSSLCILQAGGGSQSRSDGLSCVLCPTALLVPPQCASRNAVSLSVPVAHLSHLLRSARGTHAHAQNERKRRNITSLMKFLVTVARCSSVSTVFNFSTLYRRHFETAPPQFLNLAKLRSYNLRWGS